MFCTECGSAITTGAPKFCANCGAAVPPPPTTGAQATEPLRLSVPPGAGPPPSPLTNTPGLSAGQPPPNASPAQRAAAPTRVRTVVVVAIIVVAGIAFWGMTQGGGSALSCSDLAKESVKISEDLNKGTIMPLLLRVERLRTLTDIQRTARPPASGEGIRLRCSGIGYFSNGQNAAVTLTLSISSDGQKWVAYDVK